MATNANAVGLLSFLLASVAFIIIFYVARVPIMDRDNFRLASDKSIKPWWHAFVASVLTQTTLGDSTVQPVSTAAEIVTVVQSITTLLSILVLVVYLFSRNK